MVLLVKVLKVAIVIKLGETWQNQYKCKSAITSFEPGANIRNNGTQKNGPS